MIFNATTENNPKFCKSKPEYHIIIFDTNAEFYPDIKEGQIHDENYDSVNKRNGVQ